MSNHLLVVLSVLTSAGVAFASFALACTARLLSLGGQVPVRRSKPAKVTIEVTYEDGKQELLSVDHPDDPQVEDVLSGMRRHNMRSA